MSARRRTGTVKDILHRQVTTMEPDMAVQELVRFFLDQRITGAPVVDEEGKVIGVVSRTDLLRYQRHAPPAAQKAPGYYYDTDGEALVRHLQLDVPASAVVRDIMTPAAFMADENTPIADIARFMLRRHVHRVLITRKGKLAGIVTSMDLLRALAGRPAARRPAR